MDQSFQREQESYNHEGDDDEDRIPPPQYNVWAKVYARDNDGLVYESVVRRLMYGPQYHKQVQVGMSRSEQEADEQVKQNESAELEPSWHYFVHFNGWSVKFDRFVAEQDIFPITEATKMYAQTIKEEHAALRKSMVRKAKGKKQFQTVDGAEFLRAWRKRLDQINAEMNPQLMNATGERESNEAKIKGGTVDGTKSTKRLKRSGEWTESTLQRELSLRTKGLTHKRTPLEMGRIALPFALKKVLVEQWEIICQCDMVACIPASVSVREALNIYIESKGVSVSRQMNYATRQEPDAAIEASGSKLESSQDVESEVHGIEKDKSDSRVEDAMSLGQNMSEKGGATIHDSALKETAGLETVGKSEGFDDSVEEEKDDPKARMDQEWIDMADGIALMFDEALPSRLLYKEELIQMQALDATPGLSEKRYSDLFGCEFLLRLFLRLPSVIAEAAHVPEDEARTIVAKVNDFVRFLHKNQTALFSQSYRKLNETELKIRQKTLKITERKRKREEESNPESS